jgi:N-methylhydantoinase B/oxoprolinase/acetone carboxylase alpha subunit
MDDEIIIDLSDSDAQALGPINVTYVATAAAGCNAVLQSINARDVPLNKGCFLPIKVIAPPGTVVNPVFPAPSVAGNTEGQPRVITAIQGALAQAIPERVGAAEGGSACNLLLGGVHPDTGEFYTHYQLDGGGWGGRLTMDGNSAQCPAHASTIRATPIEVFESRFPLRTLEYSLRTDSGGAGTMRGGLGIRRVFEVVCDEITVSALFDRMKEGPWGLFGGAPGTPGGIYVRQNGTQEYRTFSDVFGTISPTKFINIILRRGDLILILSPGGGGYGAPGERAAQALQDDLADGFVSAEGAQSYSATAAAY